MSSSGTMQFTDEQIVRANRVDLYTQGFGDHDDPAILLIAGAARSRLDCPDEPCQQLAAGR
jgi:hypothetical protein